jgi:ABC-type oligopeptide transport system substrate-binding subunit
MNTNLLQTDTDDIKKQSSDALLKSFENDPDNINISNLYTPQESIDLRDLFNALSPYKTQTNHVPTSDFDDIMKSIDDDIKSRMNDEG